VVQSPLTTSGQETEWVHSNSRNLHGVLYVLNAVFLSTAYAKQLDASIVKRIAEMTKLHGIMHELLDFNFVLAPCAAVWTLNISPVCLSVCHLHRFAVTISYSYRVRHVKFCCQVTQKMTETRQKLFRISTTTKRSSLKVEVQLVCVSTLTEPTPIQR